MTEARRKRTLKLATLEQLRIRLLKWRKNREGFGMPLDTEVLDLAIENVEKFIAYLKEAQINEYTLKPKLGDSDYNSGHSILVDGSCNMGCC